MEKKTRTSRSSQTRDKTARRQPWRPPSRLDAPAPPAGFKYRWIRAEVMGQDDKKNVSQEKKEETCQRTDGPRRLHPGSRESTQMGRAVRA